MCQFCCWGHGFGFAYWLNIQYSQRRTDVLGPENSPFRLAHELQRFVYDERYPEFNIARKRRCDIFIEIEHADSLSCVAHRVAAPEGHGCRVVWQTKMRRRSGRKFRGRVPG
jgi:hypothetical protein